MAISMSMADEAARQGAQADGSGAPPAARTTPFAQPPPGMPPTSAEVPTSTDDEEEQLRRAIELSKAEAEAEERARNSGEGNLLDMGGGYQSGTSNMRAITWGYIAGRHATGA